MSDGKRLLALFRTLSDARQQTLMEFAAFLSDKEAADSANAPALEPVAISRPEQENVVMAIKRLRATYPMLDSADMFNEASAQMTRHLMHGVAAANVIDDLEQIFLTRYQSSREG